MDIIFYGILALSLFWSNTFFKVTYSIRKNITAFQHNIRFKNYFSFTLIQGNRTYSILYTPIIFLGKIFNWKIINNYCTKITHHHKDIQTLYAYMMTLCVSRKFSNEIAVQFTRIPNLDINLYLTWLLGIYMYSKWLSTG